MCLSGRNGSLSPWRWRSTSRSIRFLGSSITTTQPGEPRASHLYFAIGVRSRRRRGGTHCSACCSAGSMPAPERRPRPRAYVETVPIGSPLKGSTDFRPKTLRGGPVVGGTTLSRCRPVLGSPLSSIVFRSVEKSTQAPMAAGGLQSPSQQRRSRQPKAIREDPGQRFLRVASLARRPRARGELLLPPGWPRPHAAPPRLDSLLLDGEARLPSRAEQHDVVWASRSQRQPAR